MRQRFIQLSGLRLNYEQQPTACGRDFLGGAQRNQHRVIFFVLAKESGFAFFQHAHNFKIKPAHADLGADNAILLAGKERVSRIHANHHDVATLVFV